MIKTDSEVDLVIVQVKQELRSLFVKSEDQIKKVGNALKKVVKKEEGICEEIKIALKEEIAEGVISTRTIELHCPPEWKRKTKPKNEKISFSKQAEEKPQQQIATMQGGKSVIINETSSNTESADGVNQPHDEAKHNEAQLTIGKSVSYNEPKANTESSTINNFTPTHTVEKSPSHPSDKEVCPHFIEFVIPKEKYGIVRDAMDKSKASILVKFDGNNNFLGADPDVCDQTGHDNSGANHQDGNVQPRQSDDVAKDEEQTESSEMDEKQKAENLAQIGYSNHALS